MGRDQLLFAEIFKDQLYGPRKGLDPRNWQYECLGLYQASVAGSRERDGESQHRFCIYAGTGSGKTKAAGLLASYMLSSKLSGQVVVVCPNRSILRKTRKDFKEYFGIDLVGFHAKKYADGIPRTRQGYILTYHHLMKDPTLHRRICNPEKTLVIFDEVHHLGDGNGWGESATEAFGRVPYVVALTGTPYRSDDTEIPFVAYEDTPSVDQRRFRPDYTYSLGRAVNDGVCRKPLFVFFDGTVKMRLAPFSGERTVTFDDTKVNDTIASLRLRGAVTFQSTDRGKMLRESLRRCREERRKAIIFLGGDTDSEKTPTFDATEQLPTELREYGIGDDEFVVVTGDDVEAQSKIERFGESETQWVMVSINMVSEGTDIPELSAAIFLTTITAKQTTVQRIGRVLRLMGEDDPHKDALIFMFADPDLVSLANDTEAEILAERKRQKESRAEAGGGEEHRFRAEAIGIGDGPLKFVMFNGRQWPAETFRSAQATIHLNGLPTTMLETVLKLMTEEGNRDCGNVA